MKLLDERVLYYQNAIACKLVILPKTKVCKLTINYAKRKLGESPIQDLHFYHSKVECETKILCLKRLKC